MKYNARESSLKSFMRENGGSRLKIGILCRKKIYESKQDYEDINSVVII